MLPRSIRMTLRYHTIEQLIGMIDQPFCTSCTRILAEHRPLFETAQGSTHNHQVWPGGYIDHITDGMNLANHLYTFMSGFGRPLPFSRSDALLIFFLHDLEKPWRIKVGTAVQVQGDKQYEFGRWNDDGDSTHDIIVSPGRTIYTANFVPRELSQVAKRD